MQYDAYFNILSLCIVPTLRKKMTQMRLSSDYNSILQMSMYCNNWPRVGNNNFLNSTENSFRISIIYYKDIPVDK